MPLLRLVRIFTYSGFALVLILTLTLGVLFRGIALETLLEMGQISNENAADALELVIWPKYADHIRAASQVDVKALQELRFTAPLHRSLVEATKGTAVVKINLYDLNGRIIYSSDPQLIGTVPAMTPRLQAALRGQPERTARLILGQQLNAFGAVLQDRNILSTMLPIAISSQGTPAAVLQIYSDVTPLVRRIEAAQRFVLWSVSAMLAVLYVFIYFFAQRLQRGVLLQESKRLEAEQRLRASEERFRALFQSAPVGILQLSADGLCRYANPRWQEISGLTETECLAKGWQQVIPETGRGALIDLHLRQGLPTELRLLRKDGEFRWARWSAGNIVSDAAGDCIFSVEDITREHSMQEAERANLALLELLLDNLPAQISYIDAGERYRFTNRATEEWFGRARTAFIGKTIWDIRGQGDYDNIAHYVRQVLSGETVRFEYVQSNPKMGGRVFEKVYVPHFVDGQTVGFYSLAFDITDRKNVEAGLRENEARYRALVEENTDLICRFTPDGILTFVNESYCRYFNRDREHLLGHHFMPLIPEEDRDVLSKAFLQFGPLMQPITFEHRVVDGQGNIRWNQWTDVAVVDAQGQFMEYQGIGRDITDLKQSQLQLQESEERLLLALDAAQMGTWDWDMTTGLINYSERMSQMLEMDLGPSADFTAWLAKVVEEDRAIIQGDLATAVGENSDFRSEFRVRRTNGAIRWLAAKGRMTRQDDAKPLRMVGVLSDFTDRWEAQEMIKQRQMEFEQLGRLNTLGEMASGLAHELNQPLAAVQNYLLALINHLKFGPVDPERLIAGLTQAMQQAERAALIIQRIRSFARKHEIQLKPVKLNDVIEWVVDFARMEANRQQVSIVCDLADVPWIMGDEVELEQLVLNLLKNGMDAMRDTPVAEREVLVSTRLIGGQVEVSIRDRGPGIDQSNIGRIFQPFFTTKADGMGLGLVICQAIVEHHGGTIWVEPEAERGCDFRFAVAAISHGTEPGRLRTH